MSSATGSGQPREVVPGDTHGIGRHKALKTFLSASRVPSKILGRNQRQC